MICTRGHRTLCVSEGTRDANVRLRTTCLTIAWCAVFSFHPRRSRPPKNTFRFAPSCKTRTQLQQRQIRKMKINVRKRGRASQKRLMGLRYYPRWWGTRAGGQAAVKSPVFLCFVWIPTSGLLQFCLCRLRSTSAVAAFSSSPAGVIIQRSTTGKRQPFCIHSPSTAAH